MAHTWFYIDNNQRVGPIDEKSFFNLLQSHLISTDTFVWRKGLENWTQIFNLSELMEVIQKLDQVHQDLNFEATPVKTETTLSPTRIEASWFNLSLEEKIFFIKQKEESTIFGPYSLSNIDRLLKERRLNDSSWIYTHQMPAWIKIGAIPQYHDLFGKDPKIPPNAPLHHLNTICIDFQIDNEFQTYQGLAQDLSLGGVQIISRNLNIPLKTTLKVILKPLYTSTMTQIPAEVIRNLDENSGIFVHFTDLEGESLSKLQDYLAI